MRSGQRTAIHRRRRTGRGLPPIAIGLHVEQIDEAVLHKTVIMIRQYKGLQRGRYRFG